MPERSTFGADALSAFAQARDPARLATAVVAFHRRLDEVLEASVRGHGVKLACSRGCDYCCHLQVHVQPYEAFTLAAWLRRTLSAERLAAVVVRLRDNVARIRVIGGEARKRINLACALLGEDGCCTAYEARPASCRRFHSTDVRTCKASYADPSDESMVAPVHAAVAHNGAVIIAQARHAAREAGFDDAAVDMNFALLQALDNPKAWRRWRDGKKAFVIGARALLSLAALLAGIDLPLLEELGS